MFSAAPWFPALLFISTRLGLAAFSYMWMRIIPQLYMNPEARQAFLAPYPALDGLCRLTNAWKSTPPSRLCGQSSAGSKWSVIRRTWSIASSNVGTSVGAPTAGATEEAGRQS
jgi:hypothetical protein